MKIRIFTAICFSLTMSMFAVAEVRIYSQHNQVCEKLKAVFTKYNISFREVGYLDSNDLDHLYVIDDVLGIRLESLPKYFIVCQGKALKGVRPSNDFTKKLARAVAVWDYSWDNITCYRKQISNYLYFHESYEFVYPVLLPCILPVKFLDCYKKLLIYSNQKDTDISSHLPAIFTHAFTQKPKVIIEAGVRGGESTIALADAAKLCHAKLIGLDIEDSSRRVYSGLENAAFFCMNDLDFPRFYKDGEKPEVIFIDTSHMYAQTLAELEAFTPLLADNGIFIFHDSNVTPINGTTYERLNNTTGYAVGNTRGVTQAIKVYFNLVFDEYRYNNFNFTKDQTSWQIIHYPFCNGLTILKKVHKGAKP